MVMDYLFTFNHETELRMSIELQVFSGTVRRSLAAKVQLSAEHAALRLISTKYYKHDPAAVEAAVTHFQSLIPVLRFIGRIDFVSPEDPRIGYLVRFL